MDFFDIPDLSASAASAAGTTSGVPGGVTDRTGAAQREGTVENLHGKTTRMTDAYSAEDASPKSESESRLFWLEETLGATVCGCIIGSRQSVHRFCISEVVGETQACSIVSHLKGAKVEAAAKSWYITTALRGKAGTRAALADKFIERALVPKDFEEVFDSGSKEAEEWERLFVKAAMAKKDIQIEEPTGKTLDLSAYYTPLKKKTGGQPTSDGSESWEGVPLPSPFAKLVKLDVSWIGTPASPQGTGINTRRAFETIQENFDTMEATLEQHRDNLSGGLVEIQTRLNSLAMQMTSTDRRVGNPLGFGAKYGVTNAFDGIRHLCERIESVHEEFTHVPYPVMVDRVVRIEENLIGMESRQSPLELVRELEQALNKLRGETLGNFEALKNKFIGPVSEFFSKCTGAGGSGNSIFDRLDVLEKGIHEVSSDGNVFGSLKFMGGLSEHTGPEGGSSFKRMEERMSQLEARNTELQGKLSSMGESHGVTSGAGPTSQLDLAPILKRLSLMEGSQGGNGSVTLGGYHFHGISDCEAFLRTEVPEFVRGAFGYDMVSLLHRASTESMTTADILERDQNVKKGGFTNMGSAFIYTSMQQALPGPFAASTTSSAREPTPLPSLRLFSNWDKQDGQGGLRHVLYSSNRHTVDTLQGLMNRELVDFPRALSVFTRMVSDSEEHFRKLAGFLTETRNSCFMQNGDESESWEYPCRVVRGVFDECMKVRSVGAERSSVDKYTIKDASRTLWAALRCHKLMNEFVDSNFQGHPTLAGYSIQYLFKHRLTPRDLSALTTKVDAMRTEVKGVQAAQSKIKTKVGIG